MKGQIDSMLMALEIVHQPLHGFEQSLTDNQRARIAATALTPNTADAGHPKIQSNIAPACGAAPRTTNWPIGMFEKVVQPTETQRGALSEVRQAFGRAASDLNAHCPSSLLPTAVARLEAIEARLDATWTAVLAIQVALENFQSQLSDQQRLRFDAIEIADRPWPPLPRLARQ